MFEIDEGNVVRFRCRVGHAWSPETLAMHQVEAAEAAMWAAVRTLEEKGALHRRLADREPRHELGAAYHRDRAREVDESAAVLRDLLRQPLVAGEPHFPAGEAVRAAGD